MLILAAAAGGAGCGSAGTTSADAGGALDAAGADAGATDSGAADAAAPADAGADAGATDSGVADAAAPADAGPDAGGTDAGAPDVGFVPATPNVPTGFLCDIPPGYVDGGGDPVHIPCKTEVDLLSDRDPAVVPAELTYVTWNIQFGKNSAQVLSSIANTPQLANADFLALQEVPRGDLASNPQKINFARDIAVARKMNYAFHVEWDFRFDTSHGGEHGAAVLSKYPIGEITPIRHTPAYDWWKDSQRYGGRLTLGLTALVGGKRVRIYSAHFDTRGGQTGRATQGAEARRDGLAPGRPLPVVLGGDFNTWECNPVLATCNKAPDAEQVVEDFLTEGWLDATPAFDGWTQKGAGFFLQRLDWIFYRSVTWKAGEALQSVTGSDHIPVVIRFAVP